MGCPRRSRPLLELAEGFRRKLAWLTEDAIDDGRRHSLHRPLTAIGAQGLRDIHDEVRERDQPQNHPSDHRLQDDRPPLEVLEILLILVVEANERDRDRNRAENEQEQIQNQGAHESMQRVIADEAGFALKDKDRQGTKNRKKDARAMG